MSLFVIFHPYRIARRLNNIESNRAEEEKGRRKERGKMGKGNGFEENRRAKRSRESFHGCLVEKGGRKLCKKFAENLF